MIDITVDDTWQLCHGDTFSVGPLDFGPIDLAEMLVAGTLTVDPDDLFDKFPATDVISADDCYGDDVPSLYLLTLDDVFLGSAPNPALLGASTAEYQRLAADGQSYLVAPVETDTPDVSRLHGTVGRTADAGDLDGDGDREVLIPIARRRGDAVLLFDDDAPTTPERLFEGWAYVAQIADLTGDGRPDLVIFGREDGSEPFTFEGDIGIFELCPAP